MIVNLTDNYELIDESKRFINRKVSQYIRKVRIIGLSLFDSRADQIGHNVANASPPQRGFFAAVSPRR